jgi:hypothetical protein
MERLSIEKLAAYLDGEVTTNEACEIEQRLKSDTESRLNFEKLVGIRHRLESAFETPPDDRFSAAVLNCVCEKKSSPRIRLRFAAAACAVFTACIAAWVFLPKRESLPGDFSPRGSVVDTTSLAESVGIEAFLHPGSAPENSIRLRENMVVKQGDGFSFILYNRSGLDVHLILFGVDAKNSIHWFYPAVLNSEAASVSVRFSGNQELTTLPDGVTPDAMPEGAFQIIALFTHSPLKTSTVEHILKKGGESSLSVAYPSAVIQKMSVIAVAKDGVH